MAQAVTSATAQRQKTILVTLSITEAIG